MITRKYLPSVAGLILASSTLAANHRLPPPPPSSFIDTESVTNVVFTGWNDLTRRYAITIATSPSPANAVLVALGTDANGDGDLSPAETALRFGLDCGEIATLAPSSIVSVATSHASADDGQTLTTFDLSSVFDQSWNLAKITTYGNPSNTSVKASFRTHPFVLILK